MASLHDQIASILTRYVSPILAEGLLTRAMRECHIQPAGVSPDNVIQLYTKLEASVRLFVEPDVVELIWSDLDALASEFHPHAPLVLVLDPQRDLRDARAQIRLFCQRMRTPPVAMERVVTIVSELGRNIVQYTPGGTIELVSTTVATETGAPVRVIRITAVDEGKGIGNLTEVLARKQRSQHGLGRGITGVKRLADEFSIHTSDYGTRVTAVVRIAR